MAWQEVVPVTRPGSQNPKLIIGKRGGSLSITVPGPLMAALGWSAATRLRILIGSAESAGKMRLVPAEAGPVKVALFKSSGVIRLGILDGFARKPQKGPVAFRQPGDRALEIDLPGWALAAPPSQASPEPPRRRGILGA